MVINNSENSMNEIELVVKKLDQFDFSSQYSDDPYFWKKGLLAEKVLREEIMQMNLDEEQKKQVIETLTKINDENYLKVKAQFSCIADMPLWSEGNLNFKKVRCMTILGMKYE